MSYIPNRCAPSAYRPPPQQCGNCSSDSATNYDYSLRTGMSYYSQGGSGGCGGFDYSDRTPSNYHYGELENYSCRGSGYFSTETCDENHDDFVGIDNSGYTSCSRQSRVSTPNDCSSVTSREIYGNVRCSCRISHVTNGSTISARRSPGEHSSYPKSDSTSHYSTGSDATSVADGGWGQCPYQIEFSVQNLGKQVASTKRIIHFRFGFADPTALKEGKAGNDCRGEEHNAVVTWSITGGKRSVCVDGREMQYSAGKRLGPAQRADVFEAAWGMPGGHVCQLTCYAYKPATGSPEKRDRKWRQYNLIIDGRNFFELPQIFDLGLKGMGLRPNHMMPPFVITSSFDDSSSRNGHDCNNSFSQYGQLNQRLLKSSIQSRIEERRKLLDAQQQTTTVANGHGHAYHEKSTFSRSTFSSASTTSDLISLAMSMRMPSHQPEAEAVKEATNEGESHRSLQLVSTAPSETDEGKNPNNVEQQQKQLQHQHPCQQHQYPQNSAIQKKKLPHYPRQDYKNLPQPQSSKFPAPTSQDRPLQTSALVSANVNLTYALHQPPRYEQNIRDISSAYDGNEELAGLSYTRERIVSITNPLFSIRNSPCPTFSSLDKSNANNLVLAPQRVIRSKDYGNGKILAQMSARLSVHSQQMKPAVAIAEAAHSSPVSSSVERGVNKWGYF